MTTTTSSPRLYRILDFSRVVEIFEKKQLYFAHPSTWDDPYETRLRHEGSHAIFAQCWSYRPVSDAMWRIYSPHHLGVRISTTKAKLRSAIRAYTNDVGYEVRSGDVKYLPQGELDAELKELAVSLKDDFDFVEAAQALRLKREAFEHEAEWRVMLFDPKQGERNAPKGICVPVDPHGLIDRILLDPRAPQALADAFAYYLEKKLRFKSPGGVRRSALYKPPAPITSSDDDDDDDK